MMDPQNDERRPVGTGGVQRVETAAGGIDTPKVPRPAGGPRRLGCPDGCRTIPGVYDDPACLRHVRDFGAAYRRRVDKQRRWDGRRAEPRLAGGQAWRGAPTVVEVLRATAAAYAAATELRRETSDPSGAGIYGAVAAALSEVAAALEAAA